jgi:glycosyltransferase involved in cell wall biosynthesis
MRFSTSASAMPLRSTALPDVTVVVPTRDRPSALERCLAALDAQTMTDGFEVVVVDDGSADRDAVAQVVMRHPTARLIRHESAAGPAAARNSGARAAGAPVLCFTDDDCMPEPEWAERLSAAVLSGAAAVAGATVGDGDALSVAAELIALAPTLAEPFAPSNNFACEKRLFDLVPFDASYPYAAGEDRDWCARIADAGFELRSEPSARVWHHQELTLKSFLRRQVGYGEAAYQFRRLHTGGRLAPSSFYISLLRQSFARGVLVGILVTIAQAATALGFIRARARARGSER